MTINYIINIISLMTGYIFVILLMVNLIKLRKIILKDKYTDEDKKIKNKLQRQIYLFLIIIFVIYVLNSIIKNFI